MDQQQKMIAYFVQVPKIIYMLLALLIFHENTQRIGVVLEHMDQNVNIHVQAVQNLRALKMVNVIKLMAHALAIPVIII